MTVGIHLGSITDEIGSSDFLLSFFSTISGNLEPDGWGTRFPMLMEKLYRGELRQGDAEAVLEELDTVSRELAELPPSRVIWDYEDRSKMPPWGDNIADTITDLSNYFVTSGGRDLIPILREIFEELRDRGGAATIISY